MSEQNKNMPITTLSKKEKIRAGKTAKQIEKTNTEGYKTKEITIGPAFANFMGIVWGLILSMPMFIAFYLHNGYIIGGPSSGMIETIIFLFFDLILIVAHEGIHGICMYCFNGHDKSTIEFGMNSGMPYCTCQSPIKKWQYFIVLVMPTLILGTAMSIFAVLSGSTLWLLMGFIIIAGGGGDFTICAKIIGQKAKDLSIIDHPYKCGFIAVSKEFDIDQSSCLIEELTEIANRNENDSQENKKNKKASTIVVGIIIAVALVAGLVFGYMSA